MKSDQAIPTSLADQLKMAVRSLEAGLSYLKDCHPKTDGKVLDRVRPSLYPLMYWKSRLLPSGFDSISLDICLQTCGDGTAIVSPKLLVIKRDSLFYWNEPNRTRMELWSERDQWRPSEVVFTDDSEVRIINYINTTTSIQNATDIYSVLEKSIERTTPLWNKMFVISQRCGGSQTIFFKNHRGESRMGVPTNDTTMRPRALI